MAKELPAGFELGEDGAWRWHGGGVLGPGELLKVFAFMSAPVLIGCGIVAVLGNPRAAGIVLVAVLVIVAMTLLLFARFTAHYRIVQMRGDGERIRLKFAWGMRRSYPVTHLRTLDVVHLQDRERDSCHLTMMQMTFSNPGGRFHTETWATAHTGYSPELQANMQQVLGGVQVGSGVRLVSRQRSSDWR